jgi:hypothetical protein
LLLQRHLRVAAVGGALLMHAGIAVVMGLPFFSLFMMAGDCVFVRDAVARRINQPTWWSQRTGAPRPA